jgi:hypothetical protein
LKWDVVVGVLLLLIDGAGVDTDVDGSASVMFNDGVAVVVYAAVETVAMLVMA